MELRHVRINYEKALSAKKDLLSSEINLLEILKKIRYYKKHRSGEFVIKNKFKTELSGLKKKISLFNSSLPEDIRISNEIEKKKSAKKEKNEKRDIQEELEEIKRKLDKLK